jgi:hypothetical protein
MPRARPRPRPRPAGTVAGGGTVHTTMEHIFRLDEAVKSVARSLSLRSCCQPGTPASYMGAWTMHGSMDDAWEHGRCMGAWKMHGSTEDAE